MQHDVSIRLDEHLDHRAEVPEPLVEAKHPQSEHLIRLLAPNPRRLTGLAAVALDAARVLGTAAQ